MVFFVFINLLVIMLHFIVYIELVLDYEVLYLLVFYVYSKLILNL